ncbi:MAG: decarboxylating 6-phosphogluconate dehydrogenase [Proteobacteria bacterium]|nr:decarboxylating 6-phosphogluconate dehydrogenase [Pseudomonadota bacterium]
MQIILIGLGRMGGNMARRWARHGVAVTAFDASAEARAAIEGEAHCRVVASLAEALATGVPGARIVWLMLPAGAITERAIDDVLPTLVAGDLLVDGGNAHYKDSQRRAARVRSHGAAFADVGVSGGIGGLAHGYCLMVGAQAADYARLEPLLMALAPEGGRGLVHAGPVGAGHYAKMVHNGIEYGMMQALAEGFALLEAKEEFAMPLAAVADAWCDGSVIRSWLLELTARALHDPEALAATAPHVADSGEGRWAVEAMVELGVPAPVTALALTTRFATQGRGDYAARLLAQMRAGFGGHAVNVVR